MASITYIARSHLAPGHVAGGQYKITFYATKCGVKIAANQSQLQSIGGYTETTLLDAREIYQVSTQPQSVEMSKEMREAMFSMMDGQRITFNPTRDPDGNLKAVMIGIPTMNRMPGQLGRFSFAFNMRVEP